LNHSVTLTPLAEADILRAQAWYEAQRPGLGDAFVQRVDAAIVKISRNPTLYAPEIGDVRRVRVPKFPYDLWYRLEPDESVVVAACTTNATEPLP
jgi:plasmid stabilization system protein ParE